MSSLTDPWRADSDTLLRDSCALPVTAYAVHALGVVELDLLPGSTITWDETRAPRVTSRLVCSPDIDVAALDPRAGVRVVITAGIVRPGGITDAHPLANLGLRRRRRTTRRRSAALELILAGDEALVIDAAAAVGETITGTTTAAAAATILASTINPAPLLEVRAAGPAVSVSPVIDRHDALRDLAERAGLAIYDAGLRTWVCETRPALAGESAAILTTGANGTVEELDDVLDRDEWRNYVLYRYAWRNASGVEQLVTATAYVSSGVYAITGPAGKRIWAEDRTVPTTQAEANAAAADVLGRLVGSGESSTTSARAAWWLRPGHTVTRAGVRLLVQAVTFDLAAGRMTVTHRLPVTATIATTTPPSQAPAPDPSPPAKTTYQDTWVSTAAATYRGDGTKRNDTSNLVQGYSPNAPSNGNGQAVMLFTAANSTGSHTGKTIAQALAGVPPADIAKIELWVYFEHWHFTAGGTARIGRYTGTSAPATYTAGTPLLSVPGWARGLGQWVDVTAHTDKASLIAGTHGWTIGPGIGTDPTYYGRAHGPVDSNPPRIRVTFAQ